MCVRLMALENVYQVFERMPACVCYLLALDGQVFERFPEQNILSWNPIIIGYL